ncbi:MAG: hypothetical protein ACERKO_04785 [Acetanaerobacterium sp.]
MRIPGSITQRRFLSNYGSSLDRMNKLMDQVTSSRKFSRVSEDTASASKAFLVRRQLARIEMYDSNLKNAKDILSSAETSATTVGNSIKLASNTLLKALNDPNGSDREVLATQIDSYRDSIMKTMNNSFAGRYIFGGTSNEAPFSLEDTTDRLLYNGDAVSDPSITEFAEDNKVYVDIGLGLEFDGTGKLDPQTALQISTSGPDFLGCGIDENGLENNICDALTSISRLMRAEPFDNETAKLYVDKLSGQHSDTLTAVADIGNRINYIEYNVDRLSADTLTLQETQNGVEIIDPAEAITSFKSEEAAYKTCLQIGPRLIQNSLFDYLR